MVENNNINEQSLTPPPPPPQINDPVSIHCVPCSLNITENDFETHVGNGSQHKGGVQKKEKVTCSLAQRSLC